jgi:hypothetical protein
MTNEDERMVPYLRKLFGLTIIGWILIAAFAVGVALEFVGGVWIWIPR